MSSERSQEFPFSPEQTNLLMELTAIDEELRTTIKAIPHRIYQGEIRAVADRIILDIREARENIEQGLLNLGPGFTIPELRMRVERFKAMVSEEEKEYDGVS